jgi:uncharacterized membrane protein
VVDIAVRALSPGINDPTTAVHALSHVSAMLGELVSRPTTSRRRYDPEGALRLVLPQWEHRALLELGVEEPLQFASGQPVVLRRLAALLREVAWRAPGERLGPDLRELMDRVTARASDSTAIGAAEIAAWRFALDEALDGRWPPAR